MIEKLKELPDEFLNFLLKVLPFSLATLAISISVQVKNKTATIMGVTMSAIIGISTAWIFGSFINAHFSPSTAPIIIGVVTITGEKVGYWFVYKFKFDKIGEALVEGLIKLWNKFISK